MRAASGRFSEFHHRSHGSRRSSVIIQSSETSVANGTPLRIRGGGSKDFYGGLLSGEVLDLSGIEAGKLKLSDMGAAMALQFEDVLAGIGVRCRKADRDAVIDGLARRIDARG